MGIIKWENTEVYSDERDIVLYIKCNNGPERDNVKPLNTCV